jgi:hypothetical protein
MTLRVAPASEFELDTLARLGGTLDLRQFELRLPA